MKSTALTRVIKKLYKLRIDALFITNQSNVTYLTGHTSRDSYLLVAKKDVYFITDFRYEEEARRRLRSLRIEIIDDNIFQTIASVIQRRKIGRLGFEAKSLTVAELKRIKENSPGLECLPTYDLVESLRQIKDEEEIKKIEKAISAAATCLVQIRRTLTSGRRELEIESAIETFVKSRVSCRMAFETIVAFGKNSSMPHHISGRKRLNEREPVLIDMGVDFEGYKSDVTRVFSRGCKRKEFLKIYDIVLKAQELGIAAVKPGIPVKQLDYRVRNYIKDKGYGRFFRHSLGHGVGLDVHESPDICAKNSTRLMPGMVFTIEPAIYLPGKFGIRIEDIVLVEENGCRLLSGNIKKMIPFLSSVTPA